MRVIDACRPDHGFALGTSVLPKSSCPGECSRTDAATAIRGTPDLSAANYRTVGGPWPFSELSRVVTAQVERNVQ